MKTVLRWLKDEEEIRRSKKGSKTVKFQRQVRFPEMDKRLSLEYKELMKKGMKARETRETISFIITFFSRTGKWWFLLKTKEILTEMKQGNVQESDDECPTVPGNGWLRGLRNDMD